MMHNDIRNKKTVAIVQARMNSTRFPGKVTREIAGKPILKWVCESLKKAKAIDSFVVATTTHTADDEIQFFCEKEKISFFRGSEEDVLDRYYQAAKNFNADSIVRVTSDCPFLDPEIIDKVVSEFTEKDVDYASNTLNYTYPDGFDVEVMTFQALEEAYLKAEKKSAREHVTPYLKSGSMKVHSVEQNEITNRDLRVTVDYPEDLRVCEQLVDKLGVENLNWRNIVQELKNADASKVVANEGYYLSLSEEEVTPYIFDFSKSTALYSEAIQMIPDASQTFSKGQSQISIGACAYFATKGEGAYLWDVDGNKLIDFNMGLGPCILGYSDLSVNEAVKQQIDKVTIASLSSPLELELAKVLNELIPCAEMVRFGKNGSDVTSAAVRVARAFTKREQILCGGYHGWQDWYIGSTTRSSGVPKEVAKLVTSFTFNNLESLKEKFRLYPQQVAAVILEPVTAEEPKDDFLKKVIELAHSEGALVIFDEVITGFRISMGGAQKHYNAVPDLACFGKAMGNGYPISALVGKKEIMRKLEEVFFSFTMGGEAASIVAALAVIKKMKEENVLGAIWENGKRLMDGFNVIASKCGVSDILSIQGVPPRSLVQFNGANERESLVMKTYFQQECATRGLLFSGSHFVSYGHTHDVIDQVLRIYATVMRLLKENRSQLEGMLRGKCLSPVFRKA